jgi:ornithine cyclodeaminase/alanine dehydrogenase-like protein (mu-crystallin family)
MFRGFSMLLLDQATIERLATMADCIEVIDATMREVAQGAFEQPPRQMLGPVAGTASSEPVLQGAWLQPRQHINAVGAGTATQRELDEQAVRRARFFADFADFVRLQGGEYLAALRNGCVTEQHLLGSIGDVLDGRLAGRTSVDDITVYKSLGLIAQDIAFGAHLVRKAMQLDACPDIPFAAEHRA